MNDTNLRAPPAPRDRLRHMRAAGLLFTALAMPGGALADSGPAVTESAASVAKATTRCDTAARDGREFTFASGDAVLQPYGYVLWRRSPSLIADPLPYAEFFGRRGRLTGKLVNGHGRRWHEAVMDDCQKVYAEDTSAHSPLSAVAHLERNGKIYFSDMLATAQALVGQAVLVRGEGLEPRQRLYTPQRHRWYPLHGGDLLTVVGVDTHRYAHAKGVGPFFLVVERSGGGRGLIKFNPRYLGTLDGPLPTAAEPATVATAG